MARAKSPDQRVAVSARVKPATVAAFDGEVERTGEQRATVIAAILDRWADRERNRPDETPIGAGRSAQKRQQADPARETAACRHPTARRIGDSCGVCGKSLR